MRSCVGSRLEWARRQLQRVDHPVLDKIREAESVAAQAGAAGREAAGKRRFRQPLREPDGGRKDGRIWGWRPLRFTRFRPQDGVRIPPLSRRVSRSTSERTRARWISPPVLFEVGSELGDDVDAMQLAGEYVYAGRDVVVGKVLEILGGEAVEEVHNHHNFAWREEHFGRSYWVVRKGCMLARPGQQGFVGRSMGDDSVILEGVESIHAYDLLDSTVHGAGRAISRTRAAWARPPPEALGLHASRLPGGWQEPCGVGGTAASCARSGWRRRCRSRWRRRLALGAGEPARVGHRPRRRWSGRRRRRISHPQCPRRAWRHDPGEAHASSARRSGDGRTRRARSVQGRGPRERPDVFRCWVRKLREPLGERRIVGAETIDLGSVYGDDHAGRQRTYSRRAHPVARENSARFYDRARAELLGFFSGASTTRCPSTTYSLCPACRSGSAPARRQTRVPYPPPAARADRCPRRRVSHRRRRWTVR